MFRAVAAGMALEGLPSSTCFEKANVSMRRLPLSLPTWKRITQRFKVHHFLNMEVLQRSKMFIWSNAEPVPNNPSEKMWINVSMTSDNCDDESYIPHKFAMSSTHLETEKLTSIVLLGLKPSQMTLVERIVRNATTSDMIHHPIFATYLVAELMRERLALLCKNYIRAVQGVHGVLSNMYDSEKDELKLTTINAKQLRQISDARKNCDKVEVEILGTKRHLEKAVRQILPRLPAQDVNNSVGQVCAKDILTQRYKEKFDDILTNLEDLRTANRSSVDLMSQQAAHEQAQAARKEAKESARSAENSYVIAIMGMCFLPASTFATIFAMPIFKWDQHPLDLLWQSKANATAIETPESTAAGNANATLTASSSPADVLTGYVWIYCIISIGVTMLLFTYKRIRESIGSKRLNGSERPILDFLLKPFTMVWRSQPEQCVVATEPDRKRWTGNSLSQAVNPIPSPAFSVPQQMSGLVRHPTSQSLPATIVHGQEKGPYSFVSAVPGPRGTATMAPPGFAAPPRRQTEPVPAKTDKYRYGRDYVPTLVTHVSSSLSQGHETWAQGAQISQTPSAVPAASNTASLVQQSNNAAQHHSSQRATSNATSHQDAPHTHSQRGNSDAGPPLPPPPARQSHRGRQGSQTAQAAPTTTAQPPRIVQPPQRSPRQTNHAAPSTQPELQTPSPAPPRRCRTFDQGQAEPKQQPPSRVHTFPEHKPTAQATSGSKDQHGRSRIPDNVTHRPNRSAPTDAPPRFGPEDPDSLWPGPPAPGGSSSGGSRDSSRVRGIYDGGRGESRERLVGAAGTPGRAGGSSSSSSGMSGLGGR
ncbi:hypothetical protein PpBr36_07887 [Pyricularia pennisetigena]|uniref:hypothetical protein n=1 Tax=Pyricularia pennisetigena TaxID=1578925 RepID=UPI00115454E4|nr:hypothetical protein PpBr36_07887 [Pyricularia pennisetigena]TLS25882.1 hypothetical protein PpBr36_07887 [Pyricularia pennisetigena]